MPFDEDHPAISGVAVTMILTGTVMVLAGMRNAGVLETARALIKGNPLPMGPQQQRRVQAVGGGPGGDSDVASGGTPLGRDIAAQARTYIGKIPYVFGGETPAGADCSGFVTWVLHHDFGLNLPDNTHTTSAGFYVWSGAETISRRECRAGDLVCWPTHVGIAGSQNTMINLPNKKDGTLEEKIWAVPVPLIRRPYAYGG